MSPGDRSQAQQQADDLRVFERVLAALEVEGVLTLAPEQRSRVEAHVAGTLRSLTTRFDVDSTEALKKVSWGLRIVSTLGGFALATAVVLFFLHYWRVIPVGAQIAILALTPIALLFAVELAARREPSHYFAGLLSLVAIAAFVLDLSALADLFNVRASQHGILVWGLFALLLAYRHQLRIPLFIGIVYLAGWLSASVYELLGNAWITFAMRQELILLSAVLVFVAGGLHHPPGFPAVYRLVGLLGASCAVLALSVEGELSFAPVEPWLVERVYELAGLAGSAALIAYGIRRRWDGVVNTACVFFVFFLLRRLHGLLWDALPKYAYFAIVGGIAIGLVFAFLRVRRRLKLAGGSA